MATKKRTKKTAAKKTPVAKKAAKRSAKRGAPKRRGSEELHRLVGRALTDSKFLDQLLRQPERTLAEFRLDKATHKEVAAVLASPARIEKALLIFRVRLGRPEVEAV
jgi:hypothetical protein